jgi:predicted HD phosphohydrolase
MAENGPMNERPPGLGVDELVQLLAGGATRRLHAGTAVSQLQHALQTAALLLQRHPDDLELAVAGLVHDVGHLMPGVDDEAHASAGAAAVHAALGDRVAGLVALHVEAKRYLVATVPGYGDELGSDSMASLATQGGSLSPEEAVAFAALPLAPEAMSLRRADDSGKVEGLVVGDLRSWVPLLRAVSEQRGAAGS